MSLLHHDPLFLGEEYIFIEKQKKKKAFYKEEKESKPGIRNSILYGGKRVGQWPCASTCSLAQRKVTSGHRNAQPALQRWRPHSQVSSGRSPTPLSGTHTISWGSSLGINVYAAPLLSDKAA